jgi:sugar/nucleoside kinase (ribokinase family)
VPPDLVAVGHVVRDVQQEGWRLGGTVAFAAVQAQRLDLSSAIVTRHGPDIDLERELPGIDTISLPGGKSTVFQNVYRGSDRQQIVLQQAEGLSPNDIPETWGPPGTILFGPVCGELTIGQSLQFSGSLVGVSAQGWLRKVGPDMRVQRIPWTDHPFWLGGDIVFVSEEDLADHPEQVDRWARDVPLVAVTRAGRGARIFDQGDRRKIEGFPADERDPTGAGDVFAAAFLLRYHETRAVDEAARFASAAAACSVEGTGIDAIATRDRIEERMARHPDIILR